MFLLNKSFRMSSFACLILAESLPGFAQQCGAPPGPYIFSTQFYKAQARLFQSDKSSATNAQVTYGDLSVSGDQKKDEKVSDYENLTIDQAQMIIQQEHASQAANIIAECGYRACELQNAGSGSSTLATLTLLSQVCNPSLGSGTSKPSISSNSQLSVLPANITVIFNTSATQERQIEVKNSTAGTIMVKAEVDSGSDSTAQGMITVLSPTSKSFAVGPNGSHTVTIGIKRVKSASALQTQVVFSAANDSSVIAATGVLVVPDASFLLPDASIAAGTIDPNARISVDQRNATYPVYKASHESALPFPADGCPEHANPDPGWGTDGHACYHADFKPITSGPDRTAAAMNMTANVGGTCGGAFTEAPGGYGGVSPVWNSSLTLPGIKNKQSWKVVVSTDVYHLAKDPPAGASCKVVIGTQQYPIPSNTTSQMNVQLDPGVYNLEFSCSGPNPYYGCKGKPGAERYEDQKYEVNIDAQRSARH